MELVLQKITKKINTKVILSNISLSAKSGDIIIILGKSGVGKSTLLRIISGLESHCEGSIIINQKTQPNGGITRTVGLVFQDFHLWRNYSTIENISMPLQIIHNMSSKDAHHKALEILTEYGLLEHKNTNISYLSGGQKQRLAIARTIAMQPKIVCFDEPFSALDPFLTKYIIDKIKELQKNNYIIILTTHNIHILSMFQGTIYFLENGIIAEKLTTNKLNEAEQIAPRIYNFIHGIV